MKVSPIRPETPSLDPPFEFQTKQSELTKLLGPTAVITMVNGVQPVPHATLIPTGVSVRVPDLTTVNVVMPDVLITTFEGVTAPAELSRVICVTPQNVGLIIAVTQVLIRLGNATVKVEPILPVNDSIGLGVD
ncbi:MAG: hypothetical protein F2806_07325 [Actinobacteria bacterium]|nr:hypothetical protein [Actinomycetota bacterium]